MGHEVSPKPFRVFHAPCSTTQAKRQKNTNVPYKDSPVAYS